MGGFQVFDEITHIPISRLTLLFGPNSAGKSSVEDALQILSDLCSPKFWDYIDSSGGELLHKHWRRTSESVTSLANEMVVGFKGYVSGDIQANMAARLGVPWKSRVRTQRKGSKVEFHAKFRRSDDDGYFGHRLTHSFELHVDGEKILSFEQPSSVSLNFGSKVLDIFSYLMPKKLEKGIDTYSPYINCVNGVIEIFGSNSLTSDRGLSIKNVEGWTDHISDEIVPFDFIAYMVSPSFNILYRQPPVTC